MAFLARDVERYRVVVRFNTDLNFIEYIFNTERYEKFYHPQLRTCKVQATRSPHYGLSYFVR
jgi:hypothetical protein